MEIGAGEPRAHMIHTPVVDTMRVDHTQNLIGVGAQVLAQANLLGQMVQNQKRAIELHLVDLGVGDRSGKNRTSIRLLPDIAKEALHYLAFDPAALHLGQVDFIPFPVFADEAHPVVSILLTTERNATFLKENDNNG